jgi:hypothetical protein
MCRRDWNLAPKELRDQVWRSGRGAASREHRDAILETIAARRAPDC